MNRLTHIRKAEEACRHAYQAAQVEPPPETAVSAFIATAVHHLAEAEEEHGGTASGEDIAAVLLDRKLRRVREETQKKQRERRLAQGRTRDKMDRDNALARQRRKKRKEAKKAEETAMKQHKTYDAARAAIFATLLSLPGWRLHLRAPGGLRELKVPWAETPDGSRVEFRAQAVYLGAHSMWIDIREHSGPSFVQEVLATEAARARS